MNANDTRKYKMQNWKGFASRYTNALENLRSAIEVCDNPHVKTELRKTYERLDALALNLDAVNDPQETYRGYKIEDLKAAFDKVADPDDWKAPIYKRIPRNKVDITVIAIEFYASTETQITAIAGRDDVTIESIGYRAGPAGDH